ncbi:hypothetical protein PGTUg99_008012 [Puccinia graminis f. sp. tritici]|uniref:Uncharacterized protein n=1 Tax=Puccinia graminis f. sp. tritici TaxID=56615 RepID=A0A5B0RSS9_PUCGR|nr:hypothetical protein PGTUg99_008012 [Puccinia graminis f. sp. tritici]
MVAPSAWVISFIGFDIRSPRPHFPCPHAPQLAFVNRVECSSQTSDTATPLPAHRWKGLGMLTAETGTFT